MDSGSQLLVRDLVRCGQGGIPGRGRVVADEEDASMADPGDVVNSRALDNVHIDRKVE